MKTLVDPHQAIGACRHGCGRKSVVRPARSFVLRPHCRQRLRVTGYEGRIVARQHGRVSLAPMNAYERRIVHLALLDSVDVTTHSEGEDPERRVVITYVRS